MDVWFGHRWSGCLQRFIGCGLNCAVRLCCCWSTAQLHASLHAFMQPCNHLNVVASPPSKHTTTSSQIGVASARLRCKDGSKTLYAVVFCLQRTFCLNKFAETWGDNLTTSLRHLLATERVQERHFPPNAADTTR